MKIGIITKFSMNFVKQFSVITKFSKLAGIWVSISFKLWLRQRPRFVSATEANER